MLHAVIMAGGGGTRFWPHSRRRRPKQLLNIVGRKTMIRITVERVASVIPFERIMVVAGASHAEEIRRQTPELKDDRIIAEPFGRNTAPCIALAAYKLVEEDPEAIMAVLPADHLIGRESEFRNALKIAADTAAQRACLLTFGIVPDRPETGYGYIRIGASISDNGAEDVREVVEFVEKPDLATAQSYLASGEHLWNSGMFVWKASDIIAALEEFLPDMSGEIRSIFDPAKSADRSRALLEAYERIEPVSIDRGIIERADNVVCMPIDVDWNDVGSWASLESVWERDNEGNAVQGDVVFQDSRNCIVGSPHKLATLIGVEDLIVVDTPDALLICRKDRAQEVAKLHKILKKKGYEHLL